ncbi:MAG: type II secretion system protein N [Cocleimonas sp.]
MKKILFLGLLVFLAAALWQLPLSIVKPYAEKYVAGLKINEASGTVWKGEAQQLIANNTNFEKVKWTVKPLASLTSLSLKFDFDIEGRDLTAKGLAGLTPNKNLIIEDTTFTLNARYLNKQQRFARLSGDISGNINHATLNQRDLPMIDGIIDWKEAAVTSPIKLAKGDYHAVVTPDADKLNIQLTSSDAPVELSGKITLNKEWMYNTDLNIKASDPTIAPMMGLLGRAQADGAVNIKRKGDLKPFIGK